MMAPFTRIAIFMPILADDRGPAVDAMSLPSVKAVLQLMQQADDVGAVGAYREVLEISEGRESYMPTVDARPVHGDSGSISDARTLKIVTYVAKEIEDVDVSRLVENLAALHPWEHPIIELDRVYLWMPSPAG